MFGGLKKKLADVIRKVSGKVESETKEEEHIETLEETAEESVKETAKEEEKEKHHEPVAEIEKIEEIEKLEKESEEKIEILEAEQKKDADIEMPAEVMEAEKIEEMVPEPAPSKEKEEKKSFFGKIKIPLFRKPKSEPKPEIKAEPKLPEKEKPLHVEEEHEEKRGIVEAITEKKLSESDADNILKELETALLESDVAVEAAERIIGNVKSELIGKSVKRGKVEDTIKKALEKALMDVLSYGKINVEEMIENKDGPFLMIFIGFNGTGKCVSGDTLIPMVNGDIVFIKDLYERTAKLLGEKEVEGGYAIDHPSAEIFSINPYTLRIENVTAQRIWKLKKDRILRVVLENGQEVKVTPEHPFFLLKPGAVVQKRADEISTEDYVMVPKLVSPHVQKISRVDLLKKISDRKLFVDSKLLINEAYKIMESTYGLKQAFQILVTEADWMTFRYSWKDRGMLPSTIILKLAELSNEFLQILENNNLSVSFGRSKPMIIPKMDADLYRWLGLFYSEGHMDRNYIEFTNSDDFLLNVFSDLTESIFDIHNIKIKPDKRNPKVKNVIIANRTLCHFVKKALHVPQHEKSSLMELPEWVLKGSNELIASFLNSYWEGDGSVELSHRVMEACTSSKNFARQISLLLLRFGIIASISTKIVKGKPYYRIYIVGKEKLRVFNEIIGILGSAKQNRLENLIAMSSQFERTELIPLQSEYLRNLRLSLGTMQKDLADSLSIGPSLLSQYELSPYQVTIPIERIAELAKHLSSPFLDSLAKADVRWVKVKRIEEIMDSEDWVYDFTVPAFHNFVANNFIVHNTTTTCKLAHKMKKYNPVLAAGDTFRAASIEQLEEHSRRLGMELIKHKYGADSAAVVFDAVKHAAAAGSKLVLADTAGRSHANVNLMDELKKVVRVNKPDLKILVLDSLTGNDIYDQARMFDEAVGIDAIILTKADVYEKGGAAISAAYTIRKPVIYLGVGQGYDDLKEFDAKEIVKNVIG